MFNGNDLPPLWPAVVFVLIVGAGLGAAMIWLFQVIDVSISIQG